MPVRDDVGAPPPKHHGPQSQQGGGGKGGSASTPNGGPQPIANIEALNPPFDARMRKIGSPLNLSGRIQRGWAISEDSVNRVNFLYNPSQLNLGHTVNPDAVASPLQAPDSLDVMDPYYTSADSSLNLELLYDRTYELFSPDRKNRTNYATQYGMFADVAAWYTLVKIYDEYPTGWGDSLLKQPMNLVPIYLFAGPRMPFYGYITSLGVTYTHWTQNMIPQRGKISISFQILPKEKIEFKVGRGPTNAALDAIGLAGSGLHNILSGWNSSGSPSPLHNPMDPGNPLDDTHGW